MYGKEEEVEGQFELPCEEEGLGNFFQPKDSSRRFFILYK